jgi:hypothetical protein
MMVVPGTAATGFGPGTSTSPSCEAHKAHVCFQLCMVRYMWCVASRVLHSVQRVRRWQHGWIVWLLDLTL